MSFNAIRNHFSQAKNFALSFTNRRVVLGVFYRLGGVAGKFFLVIYVTKELSLSEFGVFNLFSTTVAWSVFLLGFEFHFYSTRDVVGEEKSKVGKLIFSQFVFHLMGLITMPLIVIFIMLNGFIPNTLLPYFIAITILDQLSQEGARLFVGLNKYEISNKVYFIKNGLWIYCLFIFYFGGILDINLISILTFWLSAALVSFGVILYSFYEQGYIRKENLQFDFDWVKRGLKTSWPFLLATISALTIDYSNRYFIDYYLDKEAVGVFGFYAGIANIPITLIASVFVAQNTPLLVQVYKFEGENTPKKRLIVKRFLLQNIFVTLMFIIVALVSVNWLLSIIGKENLSLHIGIFYVMLIQVFIFAIESVAHAALYSKRMDKLILGSAVVGGVTNILLNILLIPVFGLYGAAYSSIGSLTLIFLIRTFPFIKRVWS